MRHLGEQNLCHLKKMITGIDLTASYSDNCTCELCVMSWMKKTLYLHKNIPGTYPLKYIYMDICRSFSTIEIKEERYWLTFSCTATQWTEVFSIKNKSEFFSLLQWFLAAYECPHQKCHCIWIDLEGEFNSIEMENWCCNHRIISEPFTTEQHQQNEAAEVLNWITMNKLHITLLSTDIDKRWWSEVLRVINYLCNCSPSSVINKTPFEVWHNRKSDLSNICNIESVAYTLKVERKRKKLTDIKTEKCVLLDFEGNSIYWLLTKNGWILHSFNVHITEKQPTIPDSSPSAMAEKQPVISNSSPSAKRQQMPESVEAPKSTTEKESNNQKLDYETSTEIDNIETSNRLSEISNIKTDNNTLYESDEDTIVVHPQAADLTETLVRHPELCLFCRHRLALMTFLVWANLTELYESKTYTETLQDPDWKQWEQAMKAEDTFLKKNHIWTLMSKPQQRKVLQDKWVFKLKWGSQGEILRYKFRWVIRGFEQKKELNYNEIFATVVKLMSYKALFAIAAALNLKIEQMNIKITFLYENIIVRGWRGFCNIFT